MAWFWHSGHVQHQLLLAAQAHESGNASRGSDAPEVSKPPAHVTHCHRPVCSQKQPHCALGTGWSFSGVMFFSPKQWSYTTVWRIENIFGKPFILRHLQIVFLNTQYSVFFAQKAAHIPKLTPWQTLTKITCKKLLFHHIFTKITKREITQAAWPQVLSDISYCVSNYCWWESAFPYFIKPFEKERFSTPVTQLDESSSPFERSPPNF